MGRTCAVDYLLAQVVKVFRFCPTSIYGEGK